MPVIKFMIHLGNLKEPLAALANHKFADLIDKFVDKKESRKSLLPNIKEKESY